MPDRARHDSSSARANNHGNTHLAGYFFIVLACTAAAGFIDSFATTFRYRMTTYVRADFGIEMSEMVRLFSWIYLASCLSFVPRMLADVVGRKVILWTTMAGLCIVQWLVGFARTPGEYALGLMALSVFYRSDIWMLVLAEEAPPKYRARFMALVIPVVGLGAFLLGALISRMGDDPGAWRSVARAPLFGLILVVPIVLFMRETPHFREMKKRARPRLIEWELVWRPFSRGLLKPLVVVSTIKMIMIGGVSVVMAIIETDFLRVDNGFGTKIVGTLTQADVLAIWGGWLLAGFLADYVGRRRGLLLLCCAYTISLVLFAVLPKGSGSVMVFSVIHNLFFAGAFAIVRIATFELFPNDCRATAAAWTDLFMTLFAVLTTYVLSGLLDSGGVFEQGMSLSAVILLCAFVTPLTIPLYLLLPETKGRRLEDI